MNSGGSIDRVGYSAFLEGGGMVISLLKFGESPLETAGFQCEATRCAIRGEVLVLSSIFCIPLTSISAGLMEGPHFTRTEKWWFGPRGEAIRAELDQEHDCCWWYERALANRIMCDVLMFESQERVSCIRER